MSRIKTGGRKPGTPNRRSIDVAEKLAALGYDPIEAMAKIAMDESVEIGIRVLLHKELAQYVVPKRKAIEISGPGDEPFSLAALVEESMKIKLPPDRQALPARIAA